MSRRAAARIAAEIRRARLIVPTALAILVLQVGTARGQVPPQGPPGTVTLPLAEYNRLLDRAAAPPATTDGPPLAAVISRANLILRAASRGEPTPLAFAVPSLAGAQHETGEIAVEGIGAIDLSAEERGALRRLDPEETSPALRALATETLRFEYKAR